LELKVVKQFVMRNSALLFISMSVLGSFLFSCSPATPGAPVAAVATTATTTPGGGAKIAYVNIDTLEDKYELLKTKRTDFRSRQGQMEGELQRSYQQMQADAAEVQKKAQANTLTQSEYESAQKRLMQMQQSLETRKQTLTEQLMAEQEKFNKELKESLDAFLEEYNKTRGYDYILSYSAAGSSILYVNKQMDITKDVVDGMNAAAKNGGDKKNK
jgi:outer membrane protein